MSYVVYPRRAAVLQAATWYPSSALMRNIRALRGINFAIQAQRDMALQRLASLGFDAPFSRTTRFQPGFFVCESYGDWGRKFMQLRTSLTFKDLSKDDKVKDGQHRSSDFSDPLQAYHNALTALEDQISRLDGLFDTEEFEEHFGLVWQDAPTAPAPAPALYSRPSSAVPTSAVSPQQAPPSTGVQQPPAGASATQSPAASPQRAQSPSFPILPLTSQQGALGFLP